MPRRRIRIVSGVLGLFAVAFVLGYLVAGRLVMPVWMANVLSEHEAAVDRAIDVVEGSVGFRRLDDEPGGDTVFSYKFVLVNHTGQPVTVRSVRISLLDANGFALNEHRWTSTLTVPANGTLPYTGTTDVPTAFADEVVALRADGV